MTFEDTMTDKYLKKALTLIFEDLRNLKYERKDSQFKQKDV